MVGKEEEEAEWEEESNQRIQDLSLEEGKVGALLQGAATPDDGSDLEQQQEQEEMKDGTDDLSAMTCAQLSWDLVPKICLVNFMLPYFLKFLHEFCFRLISRLV